eukprot:4920742-Pyramimonas_sp.AAC.1
MSFASRRTMCKAKSSDRHCGYISTEWWHVGRSHFCTWWISRSGSCVKHVRVCVCVFSACAYGWSYRAEHGSRGADQANAQSIVPAAVRHRK